MSQSRRLLGVTLFAATIWVGCDSPTRVADSQLNFDGLTQATPTDSVGIAVTPPEEIDPTPGFVRGIVRSSELKEPATDTLLHSVRIPGVRVVAYPVLDMSTAPPTVGAVAAETTTNEDGEFTLPQVPGGLYVVTFTPPISSGFIPVWTFAAINSKSADTPWWVTLLKR